MTATQWERQRSIPTASKRTLASAHSYYQGVVAGAHAVATR